MPLAKLDAINIARANFLDGYGSKAAEGQTLTIFFTTITKNIKGGEEIAKTFRQKLRQRALAVPISVVHNSVTSYLTSHHTRC